jgi:hypothetical protein
MSSSNTLQHRAERVQICAGLFGFVLQARWPSAARHVEALLKKYLPGYFAVFKVHMRG